MTLNVIVTLFAKKSLQNNIQNTSRETKRCVATENERGFIRKAPRSCRKSIAVVSEDERGRVTLLQRSCSK